MFIVMEVQKFSESLKGPFGSKLSIQDEPAGFCPVFDTREEAEDFANNPSSVFEVRTREVAK